jgi:signal peptidase I
VGVVLLGAIGIWAGVRVALNTEFPVLVVSSGSMCQRLYNPSIDKCTLAIGDLIVIRGQDPSTIVPTCSGGNFMCTSPPNGTIIVFKPPGSLDPNYLIVHRVVAERQTSQGYFFYTRGDSNGLACYCFSANDGWDTSNGGVPAANVVGVYQYTIPIPYLGSAILSIRGFMYNDQTGQPRPEGLAVIVLLILALFAFEIIEPSGKKKKIPTTPSSPNVPLVPSDEPGLPETGQD